MSIYVPQPGRIITARAAINRQLHDRSLRLKSPPFGGLSGEVIHNYGLFGYLVVILDVHCKDYSTRMRFVQGATGTFL
ncbi:MAG TPA: hypothetical protein VJA25_01190 [Dehalococcoidia bacterium]|nr:hypothetical protein [Dehalococcoidia bacterium]